jgi:hypothetical protein
MSTPRRRWLARLLAAGVALPLLAAAAPPATASNPSVENEATSQSTATKDVLLVGNNWDGTVELVDAVTFAKLDKINVVPDLQQRLDEMTLDERAAYYIIRQQAGEGHDQLVDDISVSPDGAVLYVSRPSLGDTAAFDLRTHALLWHTDVSGYRSDHMALSPDGQRLIVSATTANVVDVLDATSGSIVGSFPGGNYPHENQFSPDGRRIYNGSIGNVLAPDHPIFDGLKGDRQITIADAATLRVQKVLKFPAGVRPFVIMPGEQTAYVQQSFLHGLVEYSLAQERIVRTVQLPLSEEAKRLTREQYPMDSAHHGLAINRDHTKICDAGTVSNYAAILSVPALTVDRIVPVGKKPYWAVASLDGRHCFLSNSDTDDVSVVTFDNPAEVARIPVGDHPQRLRMAALPVEVLAG